MEAIIIFPILFVLYIFVALGLMLVLVRPDRIRPPWWDWGLDKTPPDKKNSSDEKPK